MQNDFVEVLPGLQLPKNIVESDLLEWEEFKPDKDFFLVLSIPNISEKRSETGIIMSVSDSVVEDRPRQGVVLSIGPKCPYKIGDYLFFQKSAGYDIQSIKKPDILPDGFRFILYHPDAVLGKRVLKEGK